MSATLGLSATVGEVLEFVYRNVIQLRNLTRIR
jgi:hypothetical protein